MRKHFLILMLFALLPFAGYAVNYNLADCKIEFSGTGVDDDGGTITYTGGNLISVIAVNLDKGGTDITENFTLAWSQGGSAVEEVVNAGKYTVTVTGNGADVYGDPISRDIWVLKAANEITTQATYNTGGSWAAAGYNLLTVDPVVRFGQDDILYYVSNSATAPTGNEEEGWVSTLEKVVNTGTYYVYCKVAGTDNYLALPPTNVKTGGSLTIAGTDIEATDFTAPVAIAPTTFVFDNAEHAVFTTGGLWGDKPVKGTFKYSIDNGATWSEQIPTVKDVATYHVKYMIAGKDGNNDYTSDAFDVTVNPSDAAVITFAASQGKTGLTYKADDQSLLKSAATATLGAIPTYKVQYSATDLDDWAGVAATPIATSDLVKGKNAGFYRIEALVDGGNYTGITSKYITVQIQKATLYVTTKAETKVYGAPDPTFTIAEYRGFQGNDWFENDATATPAKVKAAGFVAPTVAREIPATGKAHQNVGNTYKISASAGAADNYVFDFTEAAGKSVFNNLTITKKSLNKIDFTFTLDATPLTYNGTAKTPAITAATYVKYDGTNAVDAANLATDDANLVSPTDYAFSYQNNVNAGDDAAQVIITGQNNFEGSVVLTFDIAQADIYVLPLAAEKNYGTDDPSEVATVCTGEADRDPSAYQYILVDNTNAPVPGATLNGTVKLQREAGIAVSNYKIYFKSYEAGETPDNYAVKNTAVLTTESTPVNRTALFTIKQASEGLKLKFTADAIANKATKVYGTATPTFTIDDLEPVAENPGFVPGDEWETVKPTLSAPTFTLTSENVKDNETNAVTVSNLASTNYPTVTVEPLPFTITARKVAVTVKAQDITYGAALTQGNDDAVWEINNAKSEGGDWNGNQDADTKEDLEVVLSTVNPLATYGPDEYEKAIIATSGNTNYVIDTDEEKSTWGKLTVTSTGIVLLASDDEVFTQLKAYDDQPTPVQINFNARNRKATATAAVHTWGANVWNALILPFDITVAELSNRLGYADNVDEFNYVVVNTVNKQSADGKFQFQLATGLIPANTPIMVKTVGAITDTDNTSAITGIINFGTKTIKAPAESTVSVTLDNGYKLVGQYEKFVLDQNVPHRSSDDWALYRFLYGDDDTEFKGIGKDSKATWSIVPFDCYVDMSVDASKAREVIFEFEEADGTITAIKSVEANNSNVKAEGWYTINGVKLQSVPTEKGIYINNGKKIVVK